MHIKKTLAVGVMSFVLAGCAATHTMISKSDLEVQTKMTDSIFLDPVGPDKKTILVQIRNTSDKPGLDLQTDISNAIASKGYKIVTDPNQAHYMLQANVLQVGEISPDALEAAADAGWGGGVAAGAAVGGLATESWQGAVGGGLIGGAMETVGNAMVEDVTYSIITDIQLSERFEGGKTQMQSEHNLKQGNSGGTTVTYSQESDWRRYQTRVLSSANQANLEFKEAEPKLKEGLAQSISGLF